MSAHTGPSPNDRDTRWPSSTPFWVKKLFTREDNQNLHKTLGFLCILSFIYRYFCLYPKIGTLGFTSPSKFDWASMALHVALSTSSLIFHVLKQRIIQKPMIIWEEYRLHAIVFTLRGAAVFVIAYFIPFEGYWVEHVLLFANYTMFHLVVDEITRRHGSAEHTTVRVDGETRFLSTMALRFYSFYQFAAIGSLLTPGPRLGDMGFNTLIAIQSSAFLMTLFRKSLIPWYVHGIIYTVCLFISMYHMFQAVPQYAIIKIAIVFCLRTQLRMSKYVVWGLFTLSNLPIFSPINAQISMAALNSVTTIF